MDHEAFQFPSVETLLPAQFPGRRICLNQGLVAPVTGDVELA